MQPDHSDYADSSTVIVVINDPCYSHGASDDQNPIASRSWW